MLNFLPPQALIGILISLLLFLGSPSVKPTI